MRERGGLTAADPSTFNSVEPYPAGKEFHG
jgi:hypothetical protein